MIKTDLHFLLGIFPQLKTVFMKQNKDYTAEILIVSALVVAAMLIHFTANQFNHWFLKMNSMVTGADSHPFMECVRVAATLSGCLFFSGFIHGRLNRNR